MRSEWDDHFFNKIIISIDNIMHPCTLFKKKNFLDNHEDEERATITCFQFILSYYSNNLISYPFDFFLRNADRQTGISYVEDIKSKKLKKRSMQTHKQQIYRKSSIYSNILYLRFIDLYK
jgi:hypothetical protein